MTTDIIVVTWDLLDRTEQCVDSVLNYTDDYRLVIVDNGSQEQTQDYLDKLELVATVIRNKDNRGYAAAVNQGMRASSNPYLVWLNNDTVVTKNWLGYMLDTMRQHASEKCGFVLPDSSYEVNPWMQDLKKASPNSDFEAPELLGGFTLVDRRVVDEVGFLDERFSKGYGCDEVDYWRRAKQKGWRIWFSHEAYIFHTPFTTYKTKFPTEWRAMWKQNEMLLEEKWADA